MKKIILHGLGFMLAFALIMAGLDLMGVFDLTPQLAAGGLVMSAAAGALLTNVDDQIKALQEEGRDIADKMEARFTLCKEEKRALKDDEDWQNLQKRSNEIREELRNLESLRQAQLLGVGARKKKEDEQQRKLDEKQGAEEYRAAFDKYLRYGERALSDEEHRLIDYDTNAGATVATDFRSKIIEALYKANDFMEKCGKEETGTGNPIKIPTWNARDMEGKIVAKGADSGDGLEPVMDSITLNAYDYTTGDITIDRTLIDDAEYDIEGKLVKEMPRAIVRKFMKDAVQADGNEKPTGIKTVETGKTTDAVGVLAADDVLDLEGSVGAESRKNACFMMNDKTRTALRKLKDNEGNYLYQKSLRDGSPETLLGYPIVITPDLDDVATGNVPLVFGDLENYVIRRVKTMHVYREFLRSKNQVAYNLFMRFDGKPINAGHSPIKKLVVQ